MNQVKLTVFQIVKWLMTTTIFLLTFAACIIGLTFFASFYTGQWHWFQRSGALIVSIGAILSTRRLLRRGINGVLLESSSFEVVMNEEKNEVGVHDLETRRDLISSYWGFGVVGFGTILWAYGDLMECLIAQNMNCVP